MKMSNKLFSVLTIICASIAVGCSELSEIDSPVNAIPEGYKLVRLSAGDSATDVDTKAVISDEGKFSWKAGDEISVLATDNKYYVLKLVEEGANEFEGAIPESAELSGVAVYPAVFANGSANTSYDAASRTLAMEMPEEYTYSEGIYSIPMVATFDDPETTVRFRQLGGLYKFHLSSLPTAADIVLTVKGQKISGSLNVDLNALDGDGMKTTDAETSSITYHYAGPLDGSADVYFPVPAGQYTDLTLDVKTGTCLKCEKKWSGRTFDIKRKTLMIMKDIDTDLLEIENFQSKFDGHATLSFMHISDLHAVDVSLNKLAKLMPSTECPFALMTGDVYPTWAMVVTARTIGKPLFFTPGNHDIYQYYGGWPESIQYGPNYKFRTQMLNSWMAPGVKEYSHYGNEMSGYMYADFTVGDKDVRLIQIDQYDIAAHGVENYGYQAKPNYNVHSQPQTDWLIETLNGAAEKDAVLMSIHSGFGNKTKGARTLGNDDIFVSNRADEYDNSYDFYGDADPYLVPDIINAYKTGENITAKTYESGMEDHPVVVNTNFTGAHDNFVGYFGGHLHWDEIEFLKDFPDQLQCLVANAGTSDNGKCQDLLKTDAKYTINYYVYDFDAKTLSVRRIGAKKKNDGTYRVEETFSL